VQSGRTFSCDTSGAGESPMVNVHAAHPNQPVRPIAWRARGEDHLDYYSSTTKRVVWNSWKKRKQQFSAKAGLCQVRAAPNAAEQQPAKQTQRHL
jgi:hypothetical protein